MDEQFREHLVELLRLISIITDRAKIDPQWWVWQALQEQVAVIEQDIERNDNGEPGDGEVERV